MACDGCERENVALMDGHYCGKCASTIASAVDEALDDVDVFDNEGIENVCVETSGMLAIRVRRGEAQ